MARVTVEDCVLRVPNRFELVMLAAQRARNIGAGSTLTVERDNDKNPVIALREIAETTVDLRELENSLVRGLQKVVDVDEPESDEMDLLGVQTELREMQASVSEEDEVAQDLLHVEDEDALIAEESDIFEEEEKDE